MTTEAAPNRAMRSDAARNRDQLLAAARRLFTEHGAELALDEVAKAAGVSRTTLYRNFETREQLAATLFNDDVTGIEERSVELRDTPLGAIDLFHHVLTMHLENKALAYTLAADDTGWLTELATRTAHAFEPLLDTGRRAGTVWRDIVVDDVLLALHIAAGAFSAADSRGIAAVGDRLRIMLHRSLFTTEYTPAPE